MERTPKELNQMLANQAKEHYEWLKQWENTVTPNPTRPDGAPSSYAEGMVDVDCGLDAELDYQRRMQRIFGKPVDL